MRDLFDFVRQPIIIGAFVLALLIVVGSYVGSHWYYGDIEQIDIPEQLIFTPNPPEGGKESEVNLEGLQVEFKPASIESDTTVTSPVAESIEDFLARLSPEEIQLLTEEVVEELPPPESIHGLGPYPEIPVDYPHQNIWEDLERHYDNGHATIEHELMHRVQIKMWNQGTKVDSSFLNMENGRIYPLYNDIVYVRYLEAENEDGSVEKYVSRYTSHYLLKDYEQSVREGTQPSWLKVVLYEDGGVEPYSFLDLP